MKLASCNLKRCVGEVVSSGAERVCKAHLTDPTRCFKVSRKEHSKETRREIKYFEHLERKGITSPFFPSYFGFYETGEEFIIEQEFIGDRPEQQLFAFRLEEFLGEASDEQLTEIFSLLRSLKAELINKNIIISDLHPGNIMLFRSGEKHISRLIVVDGFGIPEAIPLAGWFSFFGEKKIERQWIKFRKTFRATWLRRRDDTPTICF